MTKRDISIKELEESLKAASKAAIKEAKNNHVATTFLKHGVIYKRLPDGEEIEIGKVDDSDNIIQGFSFAL